MNECRLRLIVYHIRWNIMWLCGYKRKRDMNRRRRWLMRRICCWCSWRSYGVILNRSGSWRRFLGKRMRSFEIGRMGRHGKGMGVMFWLLMNGTGVAYVQKEEKCSGDCVADISPWETLLQSIQRHLNPLPFQLDFILNRVPRSRRYVPSQWTFSRDPMLI